MKIHNKLLLASDLLVESAKIYRSAIVNVDFAKSILLAGAVSGIIEPLLREKEIKTSTVEFAESATSLSGVKLTDLSQKDKERQLGKFLRLSKFSYNSLKHAGKKDVIDAINDLDFEADLKEEAYWIIDHAITDFSKIPFTIYAVNELLSDEFRTLMGTPWVE